MREKGVNGSRHMVHKEAQNARQRDFKNKTKMKDLLLLWR